MTNDLPTVAERDFRAEAEWSRMGLEAMNQSSRLADEVKRLSRENSRLGHLLLEATCALRDRTSTESFVLVPIEEMMDLDRAIANTLEHPELLVVAGTKELASAHEVVFKRPGLWLAPPANERRG